MLIKRMKGILALLLCVLCLLPAQFDSWNAHATEITDKIEPALLERMEHYEGVLPVYIQAEVPKQEILDGGESYLNQLIEDFRKEVGLEDNELVLNTRYMYPIVQWSLHLGEAPLLAVWMTAEEIYRVANNEKVRYIYYLPTAYYGFIPITPPPYKYSATVALWMLQASVGLRSYDYYYDVNNDGAVTAFDALLALQESVGLIALAEPAYLGGYEIGEPQYRSTRYEWELERIPANLFMYAGDVNGDGVADDIDLLLKYNYLWV